MLFLYVAVGLSISMQNCIEAEIVQSVFSLPPREKCGVAQILISGC